MNLFNLFNVNRQPREESGSSSSDIDTEITNQNYSVRVQGPWVFGMCCRRDNTVERRLLIIQKKDRATLRFKLKYD